MTHNELTEHLADRGIKYPETVARMVADWIDGETATLVAERHNADRETTRRMLDLAAAALGCRDSHDLRAKYAFGGAEDDPRDDDPIMRDPITDYPAARDMARAVAVLTKQNGRSVWGSPAAVRDRLMFSSIQHAQQRLEEMHHAGIVRFGQPLDSRGRVRWGVTLCV